MTQLHLLEIGTYSILSLIPFLFLALSPFQDSFRFSRKVTFGLLLAISFFHIGIGILVELSLLSGLATLISLFLYIVFFPLAVDAHYGKLLFVLFSVIAYANFCVITSKYIEALLWPYQALHNNPGLTNSLVMAILLALTYYPISLLMGVHLRNTFSLSSTEHFWKYLWILPFLFYVVYASSMYLSEVSSLYWAIQTKNLFFVCLFNFCIISTYLVIAKMLKESQEKEEVRQENNILIVQTKQYEAMQSSLLQIRQARHDLHHHINVLQTFLADNNLDALRKYIKACAESNKFTKLKVYCKNQAVNAVISYYLGEAEKLSILTDAEIELSEQFQINDIDFCVLLGNMLENALEACSVNSAPQKFIKLRIFQPSPDIITVTIDNSCTRKNQIFEGPLYSNKHSGQGIGTQSIMTIAKKYNGDFQFKIKDGIFYASVFLQNTQGLHIT